MRQMEIGSILVYKTYQHVFLTNKIIIIWAQEKSLQEF